MDSYKNQNLKKRIQRTLENLEKNNMQAIYTEHAADVPDIVRELLHQGDTVACGGSVTLVETGVIDLLHQGGYHFLDRFQRGLSTEQVKEIYRSAFSADAFLCSANAITEDGELYNVDGNSNRVSALLYGPDSVIVVAGCNKIVKDLDGARERVRSIAAPTNAAHLKRSTPCVNSGRCEDCRCEDRICCNYVVSAQQRIKGRIKVILVGEELGY